MSSISRRDFMKLVGVSVSSLLLTNCTLPIPVGCYAPAPPSPIPLDSKGRLRKCWLSFGELAAQTRENADKGISEDVFGQGLVSKHKTDLDQLVADGKLTRPVADLVQEAYEAAVYHVWRSNAPITCYEPAMVDFAPVSAQSLVQQAAALDSLAAGGTVDPQTLEQARAALEHDLAFYSLTQDEVNDLYHRLVDEWQANQGAPDFAEVDLEVTPDDKAATEFIINLLLGK